MSDAKAYGRAFVADVRDTVIPVLKRFFSDKRRKHLAHSGAAMKDGSFPIESAKDVSNAMALLHHHDTPAVRAHIRARAKAVGAPAPDFAKSIVGLLNPGQAKGKPTRYGIRSGPGRINAGPQRQGMGPDKVPGQSSAPPSTGP